MSTEEAAAVMDAPAIEQTVIALVDLSSIAHPIWHMSSGQPDPDYTAQQIVARVRGLTATYPKAAICCDKGKSFRHGIAPSYKANRPQQEAALHHQIRLAKEQLEADGYPVWAVDDFEADDLIATAVAVAKGLADVSVVVFSADKDLLQLVDERVRVVSVTSGAEYDAAAVQAKFGVKPEQMRDYLTLVGDASDNVKGAVGIGPKKAAELLTTYGTLDEVYRNLTEHGTQFKPAMASSLRAFQETRLEETRSLVTLRTDAPIPFAELDTERRPKDAAPMEELVSSASEEIEHPLDTIQREQYEQEQNDRDTAESMRRNAAKAVPPPPIEVMPASHPSEQLKQPDALAPAPVEFERQLEPRSIGQAFQLSRAMHEARMFNGYGSAQAVLSTVLAGRELGLQAVASLRAFHVIEGKHALAADAMRGLVLRAGVAKYFRCVERTAERATFETLRAGEPQPVSLTYTVQDGWQAFRPELPEAERKKKWDASGWGKHTADMLAARASSKLARLVYADILFGLYAPEELRD